MNLRAVFSIALLIAIIATRNIPAASPGDAPALAVTGTRIVNVSTEGQLQTAMGDLRSGDTLLLADGVYNLSSSLFVNGKNDVTIRGRAGSTNVVLAGKGMDNANHNGVLHGVWSNGTNTVIAHLTIRETWDNPIIFNPPAQSPRVYCVRLINAGSQFIKSNPADVNAGIGVNNGVVEYSWFEYTANPPSNSNHSGGSGYFNGISAHAAKNWIVRGNLFKNLHNPDGTSYPWNPSVLFWRHSVGTITEQNTFINVDRAVAYGLENTTPYFDHEGGIVRNNFVYLTPAFMSATRKAGSDGSIIAWNSPGTQVDHNTVLLNGNEFYSTEFRFATTTNCTARNNLSDAPIHLRDSAKATQSANLGNAVPGMFANAAGADLHLVSTTTNAIDKGTNLTTVTNDFDGDLRPKGSAADIGADELTTNAPPVIRKLSMSGTDCLIDFTTAAGLSYDLLSATEITATAWPVTVGAVEGNGGIVQVTDTNGAKDSLRFYRVKSSL